MTDNDDWTPTTAEARNAYQHSVMVSGPEMRERMGREFDRWLHGERVAAEKRGAVKALTQIAEALT